MLRKIVKTSKRIEVKIVFTLKPKHFSETSETTADKTSDSVSEQSFKIVLDKLKRIKMEQFLQESFCVCF